ncbi:PLP-dependent aminotransferase family protein [Fodinicurvata halophila]|uniref:PLP-dependent aminotransferase family protein n=1 Tax=Fodinicurvata halophila TaxID=1419723 RepID=A0ABV8UNQ7_9PROT
MLQVQLDREGASALTDQIVEALRERIDTGLLRPGTKLPSIRGFATEHDISRFTVVEAYDRLVAMGYLQSRRGAGFFTAKSMPRSAAGQGNGEDAADPQHNEEVVWLIRRLLEAGKGLTLAGGPWLPADWLDEANLRRVMRGLANNEGDHLIEYGEPLGYRPLRRHIAETLLPEIDIQAEENQVLLTCGASQALDLVSRSLLKPGDTVLVDDPGYYNLFGSLRQQGYRLIGVPRQEDGPDIEALDRLAAQHRPRLYFTQSVLQNPTSTTLTPAKAFRLLQVAERHDFQVVEDDIFSDLHPEPAPRLAALDRLERVIYLRSFSKTLSGSLRVGFIACERGLAEQLTDSKMVTCVTTSLFTEKLVYRLLTEGYYRKFLARLLGRLAEARQRVSTAFEQTGIETFHGGDRGLFLWGRFPDIPDSLPLAESAQEEGLLLAPGAVFRPNLQPSPWMRFNVAVCEDPQVLERLQRMSTAYRDRKVESETLM